MHVVQSIHTVNNSPDSVFGKSSGFHIQRQCVQLPTRPLNWLNWWFGREMIYVTICRLPLTKAGQLSVFGPSTKAAVNHYELKNEPRNKQGKPKEQHY